MKSVKYLILYKLQVGIFCHKVDIFADLCPEIGIRSNRSDSHLACGKLNVLSDFNIILYILESSFF